MTTIHGLDFEVAEYDLNVDPNTDWKRFRVGTCEGLWCSTETSYDILAITNSVPGNGHLTDTLQWFEESCRRDKKSLRVLECWNQGLKKHLIEKRGFFDIGNDNVQKHIL